MGGKTTQYRLQIPLKERTRLAIQRLSEATGDSMGGTAAMYLDELAPQLEAIAKAIEQVKSDPHASAAGVHLLLAQAQRQALDAQVDLFETVSKWSKVEPDDSKG